MKKSSLTQVKTSATEMSAKDVAKMNISGLVSKYEELKSKKELIDYNEAQTRNEFIEPMFEFLGWDMRNIRHSREVITEESVSSIDFARSASVCAKRRSAGPIFSASRLR